ncbi:olfactory receptor 145-like [Orycteropus afer afer]|uniref:Olfactory receptor 145-like n=1 Tax=Orycteropus afer afer TaxID=1230840 RepID=A0AC54Z5Q1_ORYAF|nr:olfactory receptor 145-like [Orycteropus afer afer]
MASGNDSSVTEFILLGLTQQPELQLPLFLLFFGIYVITVVGNIGLLVLIRLNPHLHVPMYYFLFNLSFIDLCYSCVISPRMLMTFVKRNIITYAECMTQIYFFTLFSIGECFVLTSMAYDRYMAICKPLFYRVIMSPQVCLRLMAGAYVVGFVGAMAHMVSLLRLVFCDGNIINHFTCDLPPLFHLSCTNTYISELIVFFVVGTNAIVPSVTIFVSYTFILYKIFCIHFTEGRSKAFRTCSSHVISVSLFFGSGGFMYLRSSSSEFLDQDKVVTIFYTIVGPMLNPFIYSLRNKDVHDAMRKTLKRRMFT